MGEKKVLIIDDERPIVDILKFNLNKEGFDTIEAYDGEDGYHKALTEKPDIILLDVMLPKMDGFMVCKELRKVIQTPIIMLTAREEEMDKVLGLELGADDYITKPYSVRELLARIKVNLRRPVITDKPLSETSSDILTIGRLRMNIERYELQKDGKDIELTIREFELLSFLAKQSEKIFSREILLEKVWGYEYYGDVRTVDVTVRRLREKIEDDPSDPEFIITKRGIGYYFDAGNK